MIDKKDLRIGNSVMNSGRLFTVDSLTPLNAIIKENGNYRVVAYENLDPIPITEEALFKMGFVKLTDKKDGFKKTSYSYSKFPFIVYFDGERLSVNFWQGNEKRYVHQLCNLFYSLTQTELTYEP